MHVFHMSKYSSRCLFSPMDNFQAFNLLFDCPNNLSWLHWILILWLAFYCWKKLFSKDIETLVWRKMQWFFLVLSAQCKPSLKKGILNKLISKISRIRIMQCCQLYKFVLPMSATLALQETLNELQKKTTQFLPTFGRKYHTSF